MPGSKKSPLTLAIQTHYMIHDQEEGPWTVDRLNRLCKLLKINREELASLVRLTRARLEFHTERPGNMPGALKLLLDLVERSAYSKYLGKKYDSSLFPDL